MKWLNVPKDPDEGLYDDIVPHLAKGPKIITASFFKLDYQSLFAIDNTQLL